MAVTRLPLSTCGLLWSLWKQEAERCSQSPLSCPSNDKGSKVSLLPGDVCFKKQAGCFGMCLGRTFL